MSGREWERQTNRSKENGTNIKKEAMNDRGQCEQIWRNFAMSLRRSLNGLGSGGGQVVSVLAFYSDDPSSNPAEVYSLIL